MQNRTPLTSKDKKQIIARGICHFVALFEDEYLSDAFFKHLLPYVNVNYIPDKELLSNKKLIENVDWNRFDNMKIVRLAIRDESVLERIDLESRDFSIKELLPLFLYHPTLVEYFDIDFSKLTGIEAINMLEINPDFIDKIELSKYDYDKLQLNEIIKKFSSKDKIIEQLNLSNIEHFALRNLLLKTGNKYINKVNLSILKNTDWIEILSIRKELLEYCNLLLFEKGDCFLLTKLVILFPELDYLIEENKNKITAMGWENLLIHNPEKYKSICNFSLFTRKHWDSIINYHRDFEELKKQFIIF